MLIKLSRWKKIQKTIFSGLIIMTENFLRLNFILFMFKNHGNVAWTYKLVKKKNLNKEEGLFEIDF
jgi:hypothetical protein